MKIRNSAIIVTLTLALFACSVAADCVYTYSLYESRISNGDYFAFSSSSSNSIYNDFTIEQIGEDYEDVKPHFDNHIINLPVVNQYPELPVGCEIASAISVLNYLGYEIDKTDFTNKYIAYSNDFTKNEDDAVKGPDPNEVFAGNPFEKGYGCYPNVIYTALNSFFADNSSTEKALILDRALTESDIEEFIDEGVPIIVWATLNMKPFDYRTVSEWSYNENGDKIFWYKNSHTLVLCGYDHNCYYFMDPNDKSEVVPYLKSDFLIRYQENHCRAVVIKK